MSDYVWWGIGSAALLLAVNIVVWCRIFAKAGYSGLRGLLMIIPIVNLVLFVAFAFAKWPLEQEVERLRRLRQRDYADLSQ